MFWILSFATYTEVTRYNPLARSICLETALVFPPKNKTAAACN